MSNYLAFLKKELLENVRTYKLFIVLTVFIIFGIMNPLIAKITPDLLSSFMPEGMVITIPEPSAFDSWAQFFNNIGQMGFIIIVIVFSGILGTELSKGTLINMLTKGLSRTTVILAKYTSMLLIWTVSLVTSFLVTYVYTIFLFPSDDIVNLLFSVFCLWLFGAFLLGLLLFAATLVNNHYGSLLITGAVVVISMLINIVPDAYKYNPFSLVSRNMDLLTATVEVSSLYPALLITGILTLIFVALAVLVFRKKQI